MRSLFLDVTTFENVGLYYVYMQWIFRFVQDNAYTILEAKMVKDFNQIVGMYVMYELIILMLAFVCFFKLIGYLKMKLLRIRLILKLIPSGEILKKKKHLERFNTQ